MNCLLVEYYFRDCFVPAETPVRVVRMFDEGDELECVASFALVGEVVVRDVTIFVPAGGLRFMGVLPEAFGE